MTKDDSEPHDNAGNEAALAPAKPEPAPPGEVVEELPAAGTTGAAPEGYGAIVQSILAGSEAVRDLQQRMAATLLPAIKSAQDQMARNVGAVAVGMQAYNRVVSVNADTVAALARLLRQTPALTRPRDFEEPVPAQGPYSKAMKSPASYFESTEEEVDSFESLNAAITKLISKTVDLPLVWRGVRNAEWGMHSYLYRHLMTVNGVAPPSAAPAAPQPYPDEDQMVDAEREILRLARKDWRFDNMSALETFARVQHAGGPTRLIDVSKNPYIGAWFAIEFDSETEEEDARLFAIATKPVAREGKDDPPDSTLALDDLGAGRDPFWHLLETNSDRQLFDWGTGARRRVWVPPAYDPRISAQNAAFILDGVPITSSRLAPYFKTDENSYWRRSDLLASSSIYAKMFKPTAKPRYNARNFAPTFSFRIKAAAKTEIRDFMESRFGYRLSYIYPDMAALANHLRTLRLDASGT